jgi:predicted DNA-binding helix-hairpin-helix protein
MVMDTLEKLKLFSLNSAFESSEDIHISQDVPDNQCEINSLQTRFPVTEAKLPNGRTIPILKTMQSSACERDCNYCCFRSGRDTPRASLTPEDLAACIVKLSNVNIAQGVFLSSGIAGGGIRTQDKILETADILRNKYHYQAYIHLKIMPGAQRDQVFRAMQLADRVSINLEAPNQACLSKLAPHKTFISELLEPLRWVDEIRKNYPSYLSWNRRWPSSCTQFVVGPAGETDFDLLKTSDILHKELSISRAYYSRFSPVINTPFENLPPLNIKRQYRLYQAFYLLKEYQFNFNELIFDQTANLSLNKDPKLSWAEKNLIETPLEINTADYFQLIKIPGIGPVTAKKILSYRKHDKIKDSQTLQKLGVPANKASKFILLDGKQPIYQPALFYDHP